MRISDWRSDVCSSDLEVQFIHSPSSGRRPNGISRPVAIAQISATYCRQSRPMPTGTDRKGIHMRARHMELVRRLVSKASCHQGTAFHSTARQKTRAITDESSASTMRPRRSEEHTSELQSLMRISYADFCLKKKRD